jgi:hypothetical protein
MNPWLAANLIGINQLQIILSSFRGPFKDSLRDIQQKLMERPITDILYSGRLESIRPIRILPRIHSDSPISGVRSSGMASLRVRALSLRLR